jgi:hypothetical protein
VSAVAPDPLRISGTTIEYKNFQNGYDPVSQVALAARDPIGNLIAQATSDAAGTYALVIATGGVPTEAIVTASMTGYFDTIVATDVPYASNTAGTGAAVWSLGDVPLWKSASMGVIYSSAGFTRDATAGTLNVAVRDCAGNPIAGVTVTIDPPPSTPSGGIRYQGADGMASTTLMATDSTFGNVLAFNAIAGATRITASKPGVAFGEANVVVDPGSVNTLTLIRGAIR